MLTQEVQDPGSDLQEKMHPVKKGHHEGQICKSKRPQVKILIQIRFFLSKVFSLRQVYKQYGGLSVSPPADFFYFPDEKGQYVFLSGLFTNSYQKKVFNPEENQAGKSERKQFRGTCRD